MLGMRRGRLGPWWVVLAITSVLAGGAACHKSGNQGRTTGATATSEAGDTRGSRPSRGEIACHLHSCAPPKYCNRDKGVCELLPCADSRDCPYDYKCDFTYQVCR